MKYRVVVLLIALFTTVSTTRGQLGELSFASGFYRTYSEPQDSLLMVYLTEHLVDHTARLEELLGLKLSDTIRLYIAPNRSEFKRKAGEGIPDWGIGLAFPAERTVYLMSDRAVDDHRVTQPIEAIALHEVAHILLGGIRGLPLWFHEGCAMQAAMESRQNQQLRRSTISGSLLSLEEIDSLLQFDPIKAELAYEQSHSAIRYLIDEYGINALKQILQMVKTGRSFRSALKATIGRSDAEFQQEWHDDLKKNAWMTWLEVSDDFIWYLLIPTLLLLAWVIKRLRGRRMLRDWEKQEPPDQTTGE